MLKEQLFETIAYATGVGLGTRCVTNGYWGKTEKSARRIASRLKEVGLSEINISTGLDHQQWVPLESIVRCAVALDEIQIRTLITVEKDTNESVCWEAINTEPSIKVLLKKKSPLFSVVTNVWMPFWENSVLREDGKNITERGVDQGCKQLFGNLVVTPHKVISACCGLTFEHIPEMRLGKYSDAPLKTYISDMADDFLKLWIHMDGPRAIAQAVLGDKRNARMEAAVHICQECAILHQDPEIIDAIKKRYREFMPEVIQRYLIRSFLSEAIPLSVAVAKTDQAAHNVGVTIE